MKKPKKSFATPSTKPVDVEYRLRRAKECAESALDFIKAVHPDAFGSPDGGLHQDMLAGVYQLISAIGCAQDAAPAKKARTPKTVETKLDAAAEE